MDSNLIITPATGYHWSEGKEIKPWVTEHPAVRTHPKTGLEGTVHQSNVYYAFF
jgi:alpha-ketoglutarate-dependent taurine dioxygenase